MTSPKTVTPDQPQAVPDALTALAALTDAFLSRHGCFPLDQTNADERAWHAAMTDAYRLVGQPGTSDRASALAARPVLPVETPAEGLREACPDCKRPKARNVGDAAAGDCPKWWAVTDKDADADCRRASTAPAPLSGRDGSLREALIEQCARIAEAQPYYPDTNVGARQEWVKREIAAAIRALTDAAKEPDHVPNAGNMITKAAGDHFPDAGEMVGKDNADG